MLLSRFLFNLRDASAAVDTSQQTLMTHLEFRLPTTQQSCHSIETMGANPNHFGENEEEEEVWVIDGKTDDGMHSLSDVRYGDNIRDMSSVSLISPVGV